LPTHRRGLRNTALERTASFDSYQLTTYRVLTVFVHVTGNTSVVSTGTGTHGLFYPLNKLF
jgi:hypothetical protein